MNSEPPKQGIKRTYTNTFTPQYKQGNTEDKKSDIKKGNKKNQVQPESPKLVPQRLEGIRDVLNQKTTQFQEQHPKQSANDQRKPMKIQCPHCQGNIVTDITYEVGDGTQCAAFTLLILFFPLFWLPLVKKECKNIIHTCPRSNCSKELGRTDFQFC